MGADRLARRGARGAQAEAAAREEQAARPEGLIELDLDDRASPAGLRSITALDLGDVGGTPLTLSDLAPRPDGRLLFSAVAQDTQDTYLDGECVGAALGLLDPSTAVVHGLERLEEPWKVEGVAAADDGSLWLVADDDDPATAAPLLLAREGSTPHNAEAPVSAG